MSNWNSISKFVNFTTKGITPSYVEHSSIIVLNQKCIRNNKIDYSFSQYTDDTKNISSDKFVKKGDILVNSTGTGTAGRCAFVSNIPENYNLIVDSHILILRCDSFFEAQCLNYVLFSFEKTLMSFMTGSSGQSELDKVVLLGLKTKMTDDPQDQQKIASVLSTLDAKIELNNKINNELEAMAKTLYDYWFVQFDFPDANGKPYKSSGGEMIYNEALKREIPKDWEVKSLGEVCDIYQPKTISEKDCIENGKYFVHGSNGIIGKYDKYNHEESGIIVSCRGDCGNIHRTLPKMWITGNAMVFNMKNKNIHNEFLFQVLRHSGIKNISSGSVQGQITRTNVSPLKITIPENNVMDRFSEVAKSIVEKRLLISEENQTLASLRDWLLPMLMNGQVEVK